MKLKSVSILRRIARALSAAEKFVAIELHPAVYVSFIAINLLLVFAYREFAGANAERHPHKNTDEIANSMDVLAPGKEQLLAPDEKSISQSALPSAFHHHKVEKQVAETEEVAVVLPAVSAPAPLKSSGAALAAVTEKPVKKKRKSRRSSSYPSGLVPPPPPGVDVVPPPPDAPSLFIGGIKSGMNSILVPPPPPMVLASSDSGYDWPQASTTSTRRSRKSSSYLNDRARTVTHGNIKRIIVSR